MSWWGLKGKEWREIISKKKAVAEKQRRVQKIVIVAEDDPATAERLVKAMEDEGYGVHLVPSGPEVLEKAAAEKPDIMVIKEILPRLNGSAVAALVDVMPSLSSTPIILYDDSRPDDADAAAKFARLKSVRKFIPSSDTPVIMKAVQAILAVM